MAIPSALVLLGLFLLLGVSVTMYWVLVWRETSNRRWSAIAEWARASGYYSNPLAKLRPPAPLQKLGAGVRVQICLVNPRSTFLDFVVESAPATLDGQLPSHHHWHTLVWPVETEWPTLGLRPATANHSMLDLLTLQSHPHLQGSERFVVHAESRKVAAVIADSSLRGLLPPDVGLLLMGRHLLLDFSQRPFDEIEFNRMIAVAEQLAQHLPTLPLRK